MLTRLQIRNFQRHELLRIRLDSQITTIVGTSDVGKSAVLRSLRWLVLNKPRGDGFIRHGTKSAEVKLRSDGQDITRHRGSENSYTIDGQRLVAFGNDVPEQIAVLLNLGEENFQLQHDPPFWFTLTPGELARELNRIVDLSVIDTVVAEVTSRERKAKQQVEVTSGRLEVAKEEKEKLSFVSMLDRHLRRLEGRREEAAEKGVRWGSLSRLVAEGARLRRDLEAGRRASRAFDRVEDLFERSTRKGDRLEKLIGQIKLLKEARELGDEGRSIVKAWGQVDRAWFAKEEKAADLRELVRLIAEMQSTKRELDDGYNRLVKVEALLKRELKGRCPLCGKEGFDG